MASLRHNGSGAPPKTPEDLRLDGYLDAARACILDVGWRRTTLTEVARRAGVSRMTIYRAWPDMSRLLGDLMTREWGSVVAASATGDEGGDLADRVVRTVHALRDNELFTRIVELDPELLLPYLLSRRGRSQEAILVLFAAAIRKGQEAGVLRDGDPVVMARTLVLALHGAVLSSQTMLDDHVSEDDLDAELRELVRRFLAR
ncbi:TetR family transcriptional regulator [Nocardioides gansuensis]|uniref:TetR family transcriptional regulator n=1 Tax=Nocardioides gansuensis TaxID=2138300 RepID=A0A2T8FEU0_9ACTN|nr:TetR/AcrR family transcriptional regulator [Nocardioides gansuensis]PVG84224.1 TetR family transcriptional regulator [Nocardioides gansuensis]